VEEGRENSVFYVRVRLTPLGRRIATLAQRIVQEVEKASR
jgi:hypothetical protein